MWRKWRLSLLQSMLSLVPLWCGVVESQCSVSQGLSLLFWAEIRLELSNSRTSSRRRSREWRTHREKKTSPTTNQAGQNQQIYYIPLFPPLLYINLLLSPLANSLSLHGRSLNEMRTDGGRSCNSHHHHYDTLTIKIKYKLSEDFEEGCIYFIW